jgi:PAS domain S-box-containing protein
MNENYDSRPESSISRDDEPPQSHSQQQLLLQGLAPHLTGEEAESTGTVGVERELDVDPSMDVEPSGPENSVHTRIQRSPSFDSMEEKSLDVRKWSALRISEIRYRRLFEAARDGILIVDPYSRQITDANPFMTDLLGYKHEELLGKELWQIGLLKDEAASRAAFKELQINRYVRYEDLPLQSKAGESRQVEFVSNLYEEDGRSVIQCNIRDITQRKLAQEQIVEQAAYLDEATNAILVRDLVGKLLFWNKGAERMYGWTREEAIGQNIAVLLYANPVKFDEVNRLTIETGEWSGEFLHLTKSGCELVIEARWTLIRDKEGRPKSVLAIYTDISEKKLREVQFMRAQRMESLGMLASGVAHDLNNILAPIVMSIDVLKNSPDGPTTQEILGIIEISARRGSDIVRQVLSFARGLEGERVEVQPRNLLNDLESIIKSTFPKDIRLSFSSANDIRTILGDPTQVHLILLNLCVNARDAMVGGGDLSISFENSVLDEEFVSKNPGAKPGNYVKLCVSDTGIGMPASVVDKIFDPFFTTKALTKGTGLGLSTVMAIVKSHEGLITVESEQGKGTVFKVYLPAIDIHSATRKDAPKESSLPRGNGETVLIVDDEVCVLAVTGHTLEAFGYRVLTAKDGADAVAVYLHHRNDISVVLADMMMPVMDGPADIQALEKINPAVKIIAASGLNSDEGVAKASGTGIKYFLPKPYTASILLNTIRMVLREDR